MNSTGESFEAVMLCFTAGPVTRFPQAPAAAAEDQWGFRNAQEHSHSSHELIKDTGHQWSRPVSTQEYALAQSVLLFTVTFRSSLIP